MMPGEVEVAVHVHGDDVDGDDDRWDAEYHASTLFDIDLWWMPSTLMDESERRVRVTRSLRDVVYLERLLRAHVAGSDDPSLGHGASVEEALGAVCRKKNAVARRRRSTEIALVVERFLHQVVTACPNGHCADALQRFMLPGKTHDEDAGVAASSVVPSSEPRVVEASIAPGCDWVEDVDITEMAREADEDVIVRWRWRAEDAEIDFSAMYTEKQFCKDDNEEEHGTSSSDEVVDPYSCVDECDEEQSTTGTSILESHEHVVAFHSRHVFPQGASWVSGQFVIPRATTGVLSIRLENAATDSIASKRVELYVEVEPVKKQVTTDKLVAGWLALAIQEVGKQGSVDNDALAVNAVLPDGAAAASHDRIEQLEIAKSQADDQVSELTRRVVCLEDELENCKHDLRKTTEQLEIASEVQKANLETITRLEFPQQASAAAASEEHDRLKELCAQFQEQCLWRSIETSESEKRNMHLEAQVEALQAEIADLRDGLEASATAMHELQAKNQQLRAQKSVLVQEVKRLQPFSQVNLSAIIQEAQEARMIQRSLQAQLLQLQQQQQQQQPCEDASTTDQSHGDLTVVDITHYAIPELQPEAERQPLEE